MRSWLLLLLWLSFVSAQDCPPCLNCNNPGSKCSHFGACNEYTGICTCPPGFGGPNCAEPVCGSLAKGAKRMIRDANTTCACDPGWGGINCNMCEENAACDALMPANEPGICYTGGDLIESNFHHCNVTNSKFNELLMGRKAEVTFGCSRKNNICDLQLWIDQQESFYCKLSNCSFSGGAGSTVKYTCRSIDCRCVPDRLLCGADGAIDISDWLKQSVKGPGALKCSHERSCVFTEPEMDKLISNLVGDSSINLQCRSSECLHYSQLPGFTMPDQNLNPLWGLLACPLVFAALWMMQKYVRGLFNANEYENLKLGDEPMQAVRHPLSVSFDSIGYTLDGRTVLQNVRGHVEPGQILAVLGGSGAGKTTFLEILACRNKRGFVSGEVLLNGRKVSQAQMRSLVGFVDQEDLLRPTLTVYETVLASAMLRLPRSMSTESKQLRALETLSDLGIFHLRDRLIGSEADRGLSGGEKRRVSIACELVTMPPLLFLDEPTSGLDAFNAYNVIECLVNLAKTRSQTIVFTIHQPRSNIVQHFDQLLLLVDGRQIFLGTPSQAVQHFSKLGLRCPRGYNVADFLIDLSARALNDTSTPSGHSLIPNEMAESTVMNLHDLVSAFEESTHLREAYLAIEAARNSPQEVSDAYVCPTFMEQFVILASRTFKDLYRNPMLVLVHYSVAVALGLLCGYLYFQVGNDIAGFQNRLGLFFFLLSLFGFSTLTTLDLFVHERLIFMRERANGYYSPTSYFAAKLAFDIVPLRIVPPVLLGILVYPLVGLYPHNFAPAIFVLTLVLFNLAAATTMFVIGVLCPDFGVASLIGCLVNLFGILFAGLFLNQNSIPALLSVLQRLSIYHYAYEAMSVNEVRHLSLTEVKYGLKIQVPGAAILSSFGFDNSAVLRDLCGLTLFAILGVAAAYIAMVRYSIERR